MYKIRLIVGLAKSKTGNTFNTFKVVDTNGKKVDCKFTKGVNPPSASCFVYVEDDKINYDNSRLYPCYWIKEIVKTEEIKTETHKLSDFFEEVK